MGQTKTREDKELNCFGEMIIAGRCPACSLRTSRAAEPSSADVSFPVRGLAKDGSLQSGSTIFKQLAIDNQKFTHILDRLREAYTEDDPEQAQQVYIKFRRFVIEHQYVTGKGIGKTFWRTKYIIPKDIGELYEECEEDKDYWYCDRFRSSRFRQSNYINLKPKTEKNQLDCELGLLNNK